ncbi:DUF4304 domain-containing protein [Mucilaginibacter sabulilitoris]|uniref:DUF4304 domain-containing protein n=1 Tax=Mucilaginibacter sabulilitoris TaxID=1173583 RepID=A0ABZ0TJU1_9SPHI|nr:DUF4304 domain-containing protein [Mucilaginibacter sabulilitoris]WPU92463.1 DUF4304 domain-containing protein [Mucilaginibacter sabulilitoris]
MNSKEFKIAFDNIANEYSFEKAFHGWFKESRDCIAVLDLQKSNFGVYYELNIKIFIQGMFGNSYSKNKDLVKKEIGDIFLRQPNDFRDVLDLEVPMEDKLRKEKLGQLFNEFIMPLVEKALTIHGIKELANKGQIFLLPAVKQRLNFD